MRYYVLIFLLCASFASGQYINWVVGGKGDGTDAHVDNGGAYDADTADWGTAQDTNGGPVVNMASVAYDHTGNGSGEQALLAIDVGLDVVVGTVLNVTARAGAGITLARYTVTSVVSDDAILIVGATATGDDTVTVRVGGALPNPGDVPDSDDNGSGIVLSAGNKIWIRALADYTTVDESDSILYVNESGTAAVPIIWEAHFAEISDEKGDFGIVTFNANTITNAVETAVGGTVYHVFIGISCENATDDGWNLNAGADDNVVLIRCAAVNNGVWGIDGNNYIAIYLSYFDTNGSGGIQIDASGVVVNSVVSGNTGDGIYLDNGGGIVVGNLIYNNTGVNGMRVEPNLFGSGLVYGCTIDKNNVANSVGIFQDAASPYNWAAINNIITDCVTGIVDDATLRQGAVLYNNLYNSNTTDASASITPQPVDGDNWGNLVKDVAENVLWTADDQTYILQSAFKQAGTDAFYTRKYWDDFNGGAGDNPPDPLTGLSFMDNGAQQRVEAGGAGGGQQVIGGSVIR